MAQPKPVTASLRVAIAGNPNAGKSSIFNALTGLRQKIGNYPGVTVERKVGQARLDGREVEFIDLPGAYSLTAQSPDEAISRDVLFGWFAAHEPPPDVVLVVVDATNLQRNLFLATQIIELGYPTVVALNMVDQASSEGLEYDLAALARGLGVPVVPTVASRGDGLDVLRATLCEAVRSPLAVPLEPLVEEQLDALASALTAPAGLARAMALRLLATPGGDDLAADRFGPALAAQVRAARRALADAGVPWQGCEAAARYAWLTDLEQRASRARRRAGATRSERIDRVVTHRWWGPLLFALAMATVFQSIYAWATPLMGAIETVTGWVGEGTRAALPPGPLADLLVDGVIAGVGSVVIFLPQILLLFLFLALLEDSGYMARAAFVMDRLMSRVGLHGRSFVPLLSSFACAIPGVMAARTIGTRRDRLTTILVAPLITCSARLPVYALMIGAFVPDRPLLGGLLRLQGVALLGLYALGIGGALAVAAVLKRSILRGPTPALVMELPPYRRPLLQHVARDLTDRARLFLRFAGSVILSLSVLLWFLAWYPRVDVSAAPALAQQSLRADGRNPDEAAALAAETANWEGRLQLEGSLMGRLGRAIEPLVAPLGFDWRIGVGLVGSFAAREVMVSTLGIIFAVGGETSESDAHLISRLQHATRSDGSPLFTPPVVAALLVFFVFACQCLSTVGVVVRETGGWKWPCFMIAYMSLLAYGGAWVAARVTVLLGG
ncbi:MAG: ferrous iron transport protein B [Fimbriimonadaceae bacterium]|nr:ferrous iron transport protein B [Fimbriimonadaceae bacterium]